MKNLFCSHTPSEENIKEVANELGLFQNVHLLACDINDVKVILNGATNYILALEVAINVLLTVIEKKLGKDHAPRF